MLPVIKMNKNNFQTNVKFKRLDEYLLDAKKQIIYFCKAMYPSYLMRLANDDEVISLIAYANMLADWRYDPNNTASRNTFVNGYAKGFIQQIVRKLKNSKNKCMSVDISEFYDLLDQKQVDDSKNNENKELVSILLKKLPPKKSAIIKDYYIDGKTYEEIGKEHGISKQAVNQNLNRAMKELKRCVNISS